MMLPWQQSMVFTSHSGFKISPIHVAEKSQSYKGKCLTVQEIFTKNHQGEGPQRFMGLGL